MSRRIWTRRALLSVLGRLGAGAAAGMAGCRREQDRARPASSGAKPRRVALAACPDYEVRNLRAALAEGWMQSEPPEVKGRTVVLKPNLVDAVPGRPAVTDIRLIRELVSFLREQGAGRIIIADGSAHNRDSERVFRISGYRALADELNIPLVDLNYDSLRRTPAPLFKKSLLSPLWIPRTIGDADLVFSIAKMKTHRYAGVTLSMKNMFGIVPGIQYGWPKNVLHWNGIAQSVCEVCAASPPHFAVVDGIVAMEGYGPLFGEARAVGVLIFGAAPLAVDATAARVMGLDPRRIEVMRLAQQRGLGSLREKDIELAGAAVEDFRTFFEMPSGFSGLREDAAPGRASG